MLDKLNHQLDIVREMKLAQTRTKRYLEASRQRYEAIADAGGFGFGIRDSSMRNELNGISGTYHVRCWKADGRHLSVR